MCECIVNKSSLLNPPKLIFAGAFAFSVVLVFLISKALFAEADFFEEETDVFFMRKKYNKKAYFIPHLKAS